ncbi:MAG: hypothetical protein ABC585_07715 [Candidatus Methanosuratincola petrocarbonis]
MVPIMAEDGATTIRLKKSLVKELKSLRRCPGETYNETISNLVRLAKESRARGQYDEFLHRVQQAKMRELWDNAVDEAWEPPAQGK